MVLLFFILVQEKEHFVCQCMPIQLCIQNRNTQNTHTHTRKRNAVYFMHIFVCSFDVCHNHHIWSVYGFSSIFHHIYSFLFFCQPYLPSITGCWHCVLRWEGEGCEEVVISAHIKCTYFHSTHNPTRVFPHTQQQKWFRSNCGYTMKQAKSGWYLYNAPYMLIHSPISI